jgi:hypothetical protein
MEYPKSKIEKVSYLFCSLRIKVSKGFENPSSVDRLMLLSTIRSARTNGVKIIKDVSLHIFDFWHSCTSMR